MIAHFGSVEFSDGKYVRVAGSGDWTVEPIEGFDPPVKLPLGMVRIRFAAPIPTPYTVLVTATRQCNTPLVAANCGGVTAEGFVVHLWETIADRTVQNAGFSFLVLDAAQS
jgi:hypothetical protein